MRASNQRRTNAALQRTVRHRDRSNRGAGFTLLEVILALALSVVVIAAVMTAIYLHMSVLDKRRGRIERAQLARNLLNTIATDIRSAVQYKPIDVSQLEQMMSGGDLASLAGTAGGNAALGELAGSDLGGGLDLTNGADMLSGGIAGGLGGAALDDTSLGMSSSQDIASTAAPPTEPGIYGNQFELQVDTSRLPRKDQYNPALLASGKALTDIPSDIKTVAYFLEVGGGTTTSDGGELDSLTPTNGLVRREIDRAVARFAINNGGTFDGLGKTDVVAAEVTQLEFRYFDGVDWVTEWDSDEIGALPMAIEIKIVLSELDLDGIPITVEDEKTLSDNRYRLVVSLPAAEIAEEEEDVPIDDDATMDGATGPAAGGAPAGGAPASGGGATGGGAAGGGGFNSGAGATDGVFNR